jgi:hypothetical protein
MKKVISSQQARIKKFEWLCMRRKAHLPQKLDRIADTHYIMAYSLKRATFDQLKY